MPTQAGIRTQEASGHSGGEAGLNGEDQGGRGGVPLQASI